VRPAAMFGGRVEMDGTSRLRFAKLEENK
jgi:hypothetical protein